MSLAYTPPAGQGLEVLLEWTKDAGWPGVPVLRPGQYVVWSSWRIVEGDSATDAELRAAPAPPAATDYDRWRRHPAATPLV